MSLIIAPSILSADFSQIENEVIKAQNAGAAFIHLDVMDGRFVPNATFGPELVAKIAPYATRMVKDTHLMVFDPMGMVDAFAKAGSDLITFHYEAYDNDEDRFACIKRIHSLGLKAGISIKPATPAEVLLPFLPEVELVLVMSVEPGKGGQAFMPESLQKIAFYRKKIDELHKNIYLEVDGGINGETARLVIEAGADVLVAGSYLYGHDDFKDRVRGLLNV